MYTDQLMFFEFWDEVFFSFVCNISNYFNKLNYNAIWNLRIKQCPKGNKDEKGNKGNYTLYHLKENKL